MSILTIKKEFLSGLMMTSSIAMVIFGHQADAQEMSTAFPSNSLNSVISTTINTGTSRGDSNLKGDVSFTSNQWIEDVGEVIGNKYFGEFNLDYSSSTAQEMNKTFSLKSRVNDQEQLMFSIPEANIEYLFGNSHLFFGRKILDWGMLDANWGLGKVNNRVNFDGFEPKQEGLTGIIFEHHNKESGLKVSFFGSVIYVPEMNPGTKVDSDKGTITCQNAWCKAPSPSAEIEGKSIPIFYNVNYPDLSDVVFRYSVGARFGYENKSFGVEGYRLRKPENQLSTTAEIAYDARSSVINADITPQFYYHEVSGVDIKLKPIKNLTLYGSAYRIEPNKYPDGNQPYIQYTGLKPQKKVEEYAGGGIVFNDGEIKAGINYIARVSEFDIENDPLVEYPRWNQAYHLNFSAHLTRKLSIGLDYKYDMLTEDRLTMYRANYEFRSNMLVSLGANIIGSSSQTKSYWSDFANNDSVFSSFKYVF